MFSIKIQPIIVLGGFICKRKNISKIEKKKKEGMFSPPLTVHLSKLSGSVCNKADFQTHMPDYPQCVRVSSHHTTIHKCMQLSYPWVSVED